MPLAQTESRSVAYLILRHLYDGDIIEWPVPDDDPQRDIFVEMETNGWIARWDRVWPLHDRYRLTERGIAAIEAVYRPAEAETLFSELQRRSLRPADRRAFLTSRGYDPMIWPIVHDPWTHWSTYNTTGARYHSYIWEDEAPFRKTRRSSLSSDTRDDDRERERELRQAEAVGVVDLDREATEHSHHAPDQGDYDVS